MLNSMLLMSHPVFGILTILSALWLLVELLNTSQNNLIRIRIVAIIQPLCIWITYIVAGYWYINYYGIDKQLINSGPFPLADSFFMEVKEHVFFSLLLLCTYVPFIIFNNNIVENKSAQKLGIWVTSLIILLGLSMEGLGAIVSMGVKVALETRLGH